MVDSQAGVRVLTWTEYTGLINSVDALSGDAELFEGGLLGGQVLLVGGAADVADQGGRLGQMCNGKPSLNDKVIVPSM